MTLRQLREARGLSQDELARKAGVDQSSICRWESGERQPRHRYVQRLARALGVPPEVVILAAFQSRAAREAARAEEAKEEVEA